MPALISSYVPQCASGGGGAALKPQHRALAAWGVVAAGALLFVAVIFSAPLALARGQVFFARAVYQGFHLVCHQMPERSFYVAGYPLAVCARCIGIYMGFAGGALAYPLLRSVSRTDVPERAWLMAAALPMAVDFALGFFGVWENTHLSRFLTGALVGGTAVFYVVPGAAELSQSRLRSFFQTRTAAREV